MELNKNDDILVKELVAFVEQNQLNRLLGVHIKGFRTLYELSQKELAMHLGVTLTCLQEWENGEQSLTYPIKLLIGYLYYDLKSNKAPKFAL